MILKLEIPSKENRKEIEKTYEADSLYIPFEIISDVLETLDFSDDKEQVGMALLKNLKNLKPLLLSIFEGLTKEELGRVNSFDLIDVFANIFVYAKNEFSVKLKNAAMGLSKKN